MLIQTCPNPPFPSLSSTSKSLRNREGGRPSACSSSSSLSASNRLRVRFCK